MVSRINLWKAILFLVTLPMFLQPYQLFATTNAKTGYLKGADNNNIFYRRLGEGPNKQTILFLHGGPGFDSTDGGYELDDLAKTHQLIIYDQRGGGRSQQITNPEQLSVEHHIADIEAVRKHFALESMSLMGLSWGSGLAALYTHKYPHRVDKLILLAPMPIRQSMLSYRYLHTKSLLKQEDAQLSQKLREEDLTHASAARIVENCRQYVSIIFKPYETQYSDWSNMKGDYCSTDTEGLKRRWTNNRITMASIKDFDWRKIATTYHGPVFVVEGSLSSVPLSTTYEWAGYYPNSRVKMLKKSGHIIWLDDTTQLMTDINQFMSGQWPVNAYQLDSSQIDLLARYDFENNIKNSEDNRFDFQSKDQITFGTNRFGRKDSTLNLSTANAKLTIPKAQWIVDKHQWSWTGWFKITQPQPDSDHRNNNSEQQLISHGTNVSLMLKNNQLAFKAKNLTLKILEPLQPDRWHHVVVTRNQNTYQLYLNAQLLSTETRENIPDPDGAFQISNFFGEIDDLRIYSTPLTHDKIVKIYHQLDN